MAIRSIREEGDEILKKKSRDVENIDDKIKERLDDMVETMHKYNGVGLAAVQVGMLKRVIVIDLYDDKGPIKLINPVIVKEKGEQEVEEGCLSFPNKYAKMIRPKEVTLEALDENGRRKGWSVPRNEFRKKFCWLNIKNDLTFHYRWWKDYWYVIDLRKMMNK